jgi:hypothetical protein
MNAAVRFREAVEAGDIEAAVELLSPEIVFHSPATFHPFVGRDTVAGLLAIVAETFERFRYVEEMHGEHVHTLLFRAAIGAREIEGVDIIHVDEQGLIDDFTVMLRPISGLLPFAQAMGEKLQAAGLATTPA